MDFSEVVQAIQSLNTEDALRARLDGKPATAELRGVDGIARLLAVDELAARRSRRSVPATYVGLWDTMRELLAATQEARTRGLDAARFSLNVAGGRCEGCHGLGSRRVELEWLPDVEVPCDVCEGRRFASDVLEVRYRGLDASELLEMRVTEAHALARELLRNAGHGRN